MGVTRFAMGCAGLRTLAVPPVVDPVAHVVLQTLKNVIFAMKRLKVSRTPKTLDPAQPIMTP